MFINALKLSHVTNDGEWEKKESECCDGCQLMALVVVVVIAIDKPRKRKAYKAQSALLRTEVKLPKQIVHMHIHIHIHTNTTVQCSYTGMESPTAAYKLLVCYFTLFWIKSKNPLLPFNLFFLTLSPFLCLFPHFHQDDCSQWCSARIALHSNRFGANLLQCAYFYSILLLPLLALQISVLWLISPLTLFVLLILLTRHIKLCLGQA